MGRVVRFALFPLVAGLFLIAPATVARAQPASSCTPNATSGFTCDLFEETANGTPSEVSAVVALPNAVNAGYVVVFQHPNGNPSDQSTWSEVLIFTNSAGVDTGTNAINVQMVSEGCNTPANPTSCFPSVATIQGTPNDTYIVENQNGTGNDNTDVTVYTASPNTYNIHSDSPVNESNDGDRPSPNIPETPWAVGLPFAGLGVVIAVAVRRQRARRA